MNTFTLLLVFVLALMISFTSVAKIYQWTDAEVNNKDTHSNLI